MGKWSLTAKERRDVINAYCSQDIGIKRLAAEFFTNHRTVIRILQSAGVYGIRASRYNPYPKGSRRPSCRRTAQEHFRLARLEDIFKRCPLGRGADDCSHWIRHIEVNRWRSWGKLVKGSDEHRKKVMDICRRITNREKSDIAFKLKRRLRRRLWFFVKNGTRKRIEELLGCNRNDFLFHLRSQFKPGMTFKNYGSVWHIDHIIPCSSFNLSRPEDQQKCFHFTNLRPEFASANCRKSDKMPDGTLGRHKRNEPN